ncbi:MAG: amino acid permease [Proteobacteria bacterium]|nr:amino acid permease [Pseudomonadota bacterium]
MIGSGIFLLPASLAAFGSISILGWIFTATGALFLALLFARLSNIMPKVGGPYAYCREAFGDFIGFQVAYNYWIALWVGNAAIVVAFVGYLGVFLPHLNHNPWRTFSVCVITVWILTIVNILGIRKAGVLQLVTTILKLLPLVALATYGLFFIHPENLSHFNVSGESNFTALTSVAAMTLWAFIGMESATVPAEDVENPTRNIPLATIVGTSVTALVYIFSTIAIMGIIPLQELAHSTAPYADAASVLFGPIGRNIIALGAAISCFGALNGWTLLQGQVPMAAARDGLFPESFARKTKVGTPITALIVSATLITLLLFLTVNSSLVKQFTFIILLATLSTLIPYLFSAMAQIIIFMKNREAFKLGVFIKSMIISIVAFIYSYWAVIGSGEKIVYYGTLLFFSAIPIYAWMKWSAGKKQASGASL